LYVAVADLIPQLQHPLPLRGTLAQIAWLALGLGLAAVVSVMAHGHAG
ncbi:MAG: ZIP family metal transporter, partial [Burkholderiaceae bacterium]